jgi:peptidyl-prolyl cis-trans isomerase SurA
MSNQPPIRLKNLPDWAWPRTMPALLALALAMPTQAIAQTPAEPVVLDRVVAVVNNNAILASDIDDEIRLSVLDPGRGGLGVLTREGALDQLISRTLIQQQIREEDLQSAEPSTAEVNDRLGEIRKELPECVHKDCASEAGWKAFLIAHGLTPERVMAYSRYRIEILRFIEERFRQGIQIPQQDIQTYYDKTLVPQYTKGEAIPPLNQVAPRIQEILLQQRVNALFDGWLENLRKQGEIEVLDPALESPTTQAAPQSIPQSEAQPGADSGHPASPGGGSR